MKKILITAGVVLLVLLILLGVKKMTKGTHGNNACHIEKNGPQAAKNNEAIDAFYLKALTVNQGGSPTTSLAPYLADGYKSFDGSDSKNAEQLLGQLEFFWKLVPDLKREPQEVVNDGDKYIVRSKATGTPNGDFFGLPTDGSKSFDIMTIDIHTIKNGKIESSHHVEDWASAMQQLSTTEGQAEAKDSEKGDDAMTVVSAFMEAMGKGDMETMTSLMDEDMVWHNEGDKTLPWIGPWDGKDAIINDFLPVFGTNLETTLWETEDTLSNEDTVAMFGKMNGKMTKNGEEIGEFTFGLRVKVKNGKIILWNWLEDSYAFSQAYSKE